MAQKITAGTTGTARGWHGTITEYEDGRGVYRFRPDFVTTSATIRIHPTEFAADARPAATFTAEVLDEMRGWIADWCSDEDELELLDEVEDWELPGIVDRMYDGGLAGFLDDGIAS